MQQANAKVHICIYWAKYTMATRLLGLQPGTSFGPNKPRHSSPMKSGGNIDAVVVSTFDYVNVPGPGNRRVTLFPTPEAEGLEAALQRETDRLVAAFATLLS